MADPDHTFHISLLCRIQQDIPNHEPCHSKECDRDAMCFEPCMCFCHKPVARAILHDHHVSWHGDQLHYGRITETW